MLKKTIVFFLFLTPIFLAAAQIGTFEEFYSPDKSWGFWTWMILITSIVVAIGITISTGGAAAPVGAEAIGVALGFTGSAAIIVGTAILIGAGEVTIQIALDEAMAKFSYDRFKSDSKNMTYLPLMNNPYGGGECEKVFNVLKNIDTKKRLDSNYNIEILNKSLKILENSTSIGKSRYKEDLIKSVILFQKGEYKESKEVVEKYLKDPPIYDISLAMPSFIYAVTSFYDDVIDINGSILTLKQSVILEPDNPILMLMYGIYMDRFIYLLDYDKLSVSSYYNIIDTVCHVSDEKKKAMILYILYARCIGLMEKCYKEIDIITKDESFNTFNTEKLLWKKSFLKSELEKVSDKIYSNYLKLKLDEDNETTKGMNELNKKAESLKNLNERIIMIKYSLHKHIWVLIILILAIFYFIYRKRIKTA